MSDTAQEILDTALDLFAAQGFHGTSIREIAEEVGIRKSSIYNHFSSKEEILKQLFASYEPAGSLQKELFSNDQETGGLPGNISDPGMILNYVKEKVLAEITDKRQQKFLRIMMREHTSEIVSEKIKERLIQGNLERKKKFIQKLKQPENIDEDEAEFLAYEYIALFFLFRVLVLFDEGEAMEEKFASFAEKHNELFLHLLKNDNLNQN